MRDSEKNSPDNSNVIQLSFGYRKFDFLGSNLGRVYCIIIIITIIMLTLLVLQILSDLGTYLHKAIPDTRLTIRRYADAKFEYLSYCLKVKEMDDEEMQFAHLQEPLYRIETGNYEYRYAVVGVIVVRPLGDCKRLVSQDRAAHDFNMNLSVSLKGVLSYCDSPNDY